MTIQEKGGRARARALSPRRRSQIAREAALTRWTGDGDVRLAQNRVNTLWVAREAARERVRELTGKITEARAALREAVREFNRR